MVYGCLWHRFTRFTTWFQGSSSISAACNSSSIHHSANVTLASIDELNLLVSPQKISKCLHLFAVFYHSSNMTSISLPPVYSGSSFLDATCASFWYILIHSRKYGFDQIFWYKRKWVWPNLHSVNSANPMFVTCLDGNFDGRKFRWLTEVPRRWCRTRVKLSNIRTYHW